jgi:hypothetical protein
MAAETPVGFMSGMRSSGILIGTATEIRLGAPGPEVFPILLLGWWPKWRHPNRAVAMLQFRAATTQMFVGIHAKTTIRIGRDAAILATAAECRIRKLKLRMGGSVIVVAEMMFATDLAKDTADAILAGAIVPEIVIATGAAAEVEAGTNAAAEVEAEIAGARTEATTRGPAAVTTAMFAAVAAVVPLLSHLPRLAAA